MSILARAGSLLSAGLIHAPLAVGQAVPVVEPATVLARADTTFTRVAGVRELSDGHVLVLDVDDRAAFLLDGRLQVVRQVGRSGSGPGEYRQPVQLFALEGDSTGIVDLSNGRIMIVEPDGAAGGFVPRVRSGRSGAPTLRALAADRRGFLYAHVQRLGQTTQIVRWHPRGEGAEVVGEMPPASTENVAVSSAIPAVVTSRQGPFGSESQWAVAGDGRVVVAHLNPYHVEYFRPDGVRVVGSAVQYRPIRVTEQHKEEWRAERRRPQSLLVVGRNGANAGSVMGTLSAREPDWPDVLPVFPRGALHFAPDGMLWVQRTTPAGEGLLFDIFGATGSRIRQVRLPSGARLVGLGAGCAYVVHKDRFDLEHLQRVAVRY